MKKTETAGKHCPTVERFIVELWAEKRYGLMYPIGIEQ